MRASAPPDRNAVLIAYILFVLAGLAFGYAAFGPLKLLAFAFPLLLAIGPALRQGVDETFLLRLLLAVLLTAAGIVAGTALDRRSAPS